MLGSAVAVLLRESDEVRELVAKVVLRLGEMVPSSSATLIRSKAAGGLGR